ncbi:lipoyl(octanoyl) transferase LipB [soil metagenome]
MSQDRIEWRRDTVPVAYPEALADMESRAAGIVADQADERVWLLEHPPLYTAGTSADPAEMLDRRFPVYDAGRGGRYTYHGPGQRVGYLSIDLGARGKDIRNFVHNLEGWLIDSLGEFGIAARRAEGRIGIWTDTPDGREAKIGAIGVRVRKWVTMHGFSVNIDPDLSHFGGIIPCGISEFSVTSLRALGSQATMEEFDTVLKRHFPAFLARLGRCGEKRGA